MSAHSTSVGEDDLDYQQDYATALSGFSDNIDAFQVAYAATTSDKGLANYDRTNDIETLVKQIVNLLKNVLSSTDNLVYNLPIVGPIVGPSECFNAITNCSRP